MAEPQIVQVRIPGARRSYAYTWDGEPLEVGQWVHLPGNDVSPDGTEGRVEGFGADGYKGPMKAIVAVKDRQDPWLARMRQVRTAADRLQVYRKAQRAGITGERLAALVAEGKRVLAERESTAPTAWAARVLNKPLCGDDRDASTVSPPLTSAEDAAEHRARTVAVSLGRVDGPAQQRTDWGEWE